MIIKIPKHNEARNFLESILYKRIGEEEGKDIYEGTLPFRIHRDVLNFNVKEFRKFSRSVYVEGGYKKGTDEYLDVSPHADAVVHFRISSGEYELFKQYVKAHRTTLSECLRLAILERLNQWLALPRKEKKPTDLEYG